MSSRGIATLCFELNQGRAAQMGMLALMVHDKLGNVNDLLPWLN
jgi:hypothetical protein